MPLVSIADDGKMEVISDGKSNPQTVNAVFASFFCFKLTYNLYMQVLFIKYNNMITEY